MALFDEKDAFIERISREFFLQAGRSRNLDAMIAAVLESFRVLDGRFVPQVATPTIRMRMDAITQTYLSWRDPQYLDAVEDLLLNMNTIDDFIFALQDDINGLIVSPNAVTPAKQAAIERVTASLTRSAYDRFYRTEVREGLVRMVSRGQSIDEFRQWLTHRVRQPSYAKYASFNGAMQYDGDIQNEIANRYELDGIRYVGSIVRDSRPQCRRWRRKREFARAELQAEIDWMFRRGEGYIRSTTTSNFFRYRGGHNCRHNAFPVLLRT